jgi:predicted alpha/beta-fold hydrolase
VSEQTQDALVGTQSGKFEPHPLLVNGHAMTIAGAFWPRKFALPPGEERLFKVEAGTRLLGHCHWQAERRERPTIVLVHGLEGSSDSPYMRGIAEKAFRTGLSVVRLNQRNCGGTEGLTPTLYNSGMSRDYRAVLFELIERDKLREIFFAGYSMGGNLVLKMAGELGTKVPAELQGVCGVCPAVDLAGCADALEKRENFFYERHFVNGLMSRYRHKARLFPERYPRDGFGPVRTVREFDDKITAPQFGYRDAEEYYADASARRVTGAIRVRTLIVTAQDDPIVPYASFAAQGIRENPAIRLEAPEHGGHCAFVSKHGGAGRFWAERRIVEFCEEMRIVK